MGEGQNVPAPTGVFFHSQNCNFPEESFILKEPKLEIFGFGFFLHKSNLYG
jgi:hypothetical protein